MLKAGLGLCWGVWLRWIVLAQAQGMQALSQKSCCLTTQLHVTEKLHEQLLALLH